MSAPIGPGDWVECVDAAPRHFSLFVGTPLVEGAVYRVTAIHPDPDNNGSGAGILLAEVSPSPPFEWFAIERFRPIYRPRADFIESLKAPPERVLDRVTA